MPPGESRRISALIERRNVSFSRLTIAPIKIPKGQRERCKQGPKRENFKNQDRIHYLLHPKLFLIERQLTQPLQTKDFSLKKAQAPFAEV